MRIITLDVNKKVINPKIVNDGYLENPGLQLGEIISDIGETGQIQQLDGSFINDTTPVIPPIIQPTNQEINDNQMTIMDVLATLYEAMTLKGTV